MNKLKPITKIEDQCIVGQQSWKRGRQHFKTRSR